MFKPHAGRQEGKQAEKNVVVIDEMRITRETRIWKYFFFFFFLTFCILLHIKKYACLFDGYMSQRQQDDDDNRKQKQREGKNSFIHSRLGSSKYFKTKKNFLIQRNFLEFVFYVLNEYKNHRYNRYFGTNKQIHLNYGWIKKRS